MRLPVGADQSVGFGGDADAAVDDGDEMGEGRVVEDRARPRPIDAAEDHVAVQREREALGLDDAELVGVDARLGGGRALEQAAAQGLDLGAAQAHVALGGVQEAVEVVLLDGVEVDQDEVPDAGTDQRRLKTTRGKITHPDIGRIGVVDGMGVEADSPQKVGLTTAHRRLLHGTSGPRCTRSPTRPRRAPGALLGRLQGRRHH